jgi:hypothetical protein
MLDFHILLVCTCISLNAVHSDTKHVLVKMLFHCHGTISGSRRKEDGGKIKD